MISVITAVFNGERFIEACIQVVVQQNHSPVEHIIVDGASADHTVDIIKTNAAKYPHIRWISEKDNGQPDALNKGIEMAKGDILAILNVDDYYEPNVLNRVAHTFKTLPDPSLLVGNCSVWDNKGKLLYQNKPSKLGIKDLLLGWAYHPHPVNPSAYFYHKSLHEIIGPYDDDEQTGLIHDLSFILSAVQIANIKYIDEFFGNWVKYENTLTEIDLAAGLMEKRKRIVMNRYYKKLPPINKAEVTVKRLLYKFGRKFNQVVRFYRKN